MKTSKSKSIDENNKDYNITISKDCSHCEKFYNKNLDLNLLYENKNEIKFLILRSLTKTELIIMCYYYNIHKKSLNLYIK